MGKRDTPREDLCTVVAVAYQEGVIISTQPITGSKDGVIFFSNKEYALGYDRFGNIVRYSVKAYKWQRVPTDTKGIKRMISYFQQKKREYPGVHHINLYGGISKKFKKQIPIPNWNI
jgi:hypothetical protein